MLLSIISNRRAILIEGQYLIEGHHFIFDNSIIKNMIYEKDFNEI